MTTKTVRFMILSTIVSLLAIQMIFAATFTVAPTSLRFTEPTNKMTFTLTPPLNATSDYTITYPTILQNNNVPISFFHTGNVTGITSPQVITVNAGVDYSELSSGKTYSGNIIVTNAANSQDTITIPVSFVSSFCKAGEQGDDLEITEVRIDNSDGADDEWSPLDDITIRVEASNNGNEKVKNVYIELGLFNEKGKNIINKMDNFDSSRIKLGNIKDGDQDSSEYTFTVPSDFEAENYRLVVKAYGDDIGESKLCVSQSSDLDSDFYQSISGERETDEKKQVIFTNIKVTPSPAQCGDKIQITGEVANIGDEDYSDQVKVNLYNADLSLNIDQIARGDLDQGDSRVVDFEFDMPRNAVEKSYVIDFRTFYDYDDNDETYGFQSDERFTQSVRVEGNCNTGSTTEEESNVVINAQLNEETPQAIAGKQVVIDATIRNTGSVDSTYAISVVGNEDWSQLVSIDPQGVKVAPGQSKTVTIILSVNPTVVEGEKDFLIRTSFGGRSKDQRVSMLVTNNEGTSTGESQLDPLVNHLRTNWFIYLIILVNVILIVAIILVIRSMVSPSPHAL